MEDKFRKCPVCGSGNLKYIERAAVYFCKDCDHEFPAEKPIAPMRIFLSYGHDGNEELVRRIKADLEKRGHDVWFDKNEIKFGDDWRRSITDGILKSNRVLSFLSKHSTRDPGVCRDEIAIAIGVKEGNIQTILIESEQEVQPPVNIGHIQWLDMHDWKKRRDAGEDTWKKWYQEKLTEIIRVVESGESRRFAGEIETLSSHLKPIKFYARINDLLRRGFYGREWLFEAVENWRSAPKGAPSRLFWIMGAPGVGKSAFAAQLTHKHGDTVIAAQFCEWDKPDHRDAQRVVRSLAFQLATRLPDYRKLLLTLPEIAGLDRKDAAELFDYLLANPLRSVIDGGRNQYLIVIDALDEAGESGRNPLVEMLARHAKLLPDWLGLVVTSRPEFDVKTPFPLDTESEANRADIRAYLHSELAVHLQNRPDADRLVEQILGKSEGVFLYVERFCDDVRQGHISLDRPEQFPQGLGGIFNQYFKRQFPDLEKFRKDIRPALRAILAAREPLPIEILQRLFTCQDEELRDFTRPLASLFPVISEAGQKVIKPYHKSLTDWLEDDEKAGAYFVSVLEGQRALADYFSARWQHDKYALSEVVFFLAATGRFADTRELLFGQEFRKIKKDILGVESITADFLHAEKNSNGYFGLAGPAWYLLQFAEKKFNAMIHKAAAEGGGTVMSRYLSVRHEMFEKACKLSVEWLSGKHSVRRCAKFCEEALLLFADDLPLVVKSAALLRRQAEETEPLNNLEEVRNKVQQALTKVANTPRIRSGYGPAMVDSAWQILDYQEKALSATLAALHLRPLQTTNDIWAARRFKAIADCDTDPWGAIGIAVRDADEALEAKLTRSVEWLLSASSSGSKP